MDNKGVKVKEAPAEVGILYRRAKHLTGLTPVNLSY